MGALPARDIHALSGFPNMDSSGLTVKVTEPDGTDHWVSIHSLSGGEIRRLAKLVDADRTGWPNVDRDTLSGRIHVAVRSWIASHPAEDAMRFAPAAPAPAPAAEAPAPAAAAEAPAPAAEAAAEAPAPAAEAAAEAPAPAPAAEAPAPAEDEDELLTLIRKLMARNSMSTDEVRALVDEATSGLLDTVQTMLAEAGRPVVREIHIPGREVRTVEGRQHSAFETLVKVISAGEHAWLVGPAGTGKSYLASSVAEALEMEYSEQSCAGDIGSHQFLGFIDGRGEYRSTEFRRIYEHGGIFLFDEVDGAAPEVLMVLNNALANKRCAFPDRLVNRHPDFVAIGAANTFGNGATSEYVGRSVIDAATLDRFTFVTVANDEELERDIVESVVASSVAADILFAVRVMRGNAERYGLRAIISPRGSLGVARLVRSGFPLSEALDMRILKGADEPTRRKVTETLTLWGK